MEFTHLTSQYELKEK
ncbi:hypothetical protein RSAG8_13969, partial [Rhizoctonia solani AG-8 WAC10335]